MTIFHALPLEMYHFEEDLLMDSSGIPGTHKAFATSASHRWLHCSASVKKPDTGRRPSGTAAKEGTAAHLLLSWILAHKALNERPPIPKVIEVEGEQFPVERSLLQSLSEMSDLWNDADEVWSEISTIPFPSFASACGGTADLITWTEKGQVLHVCDFKYGRGYVSEVGNTQLLLYALGAIRHSGKKPQLIHLSIYQPRAPGHERSPLRTWTVESEVLKKRLLPLLEALQRARDTPEQMEAGEWCKWCDHQPTCPAWQTMMTGLHESDQASHETLVELGRLRGALKSWIDGVDALLKSHLQAGKTLDTVKLVHGPGRRRWSVEHAILVESLPTMIRSAVEDDIFTLKSVAKIEELIHKDHRDAFKDLWTRGNPSLLLADASDSRPALGTGEEFDSTADTEEFV